MPAAAWRSGGPGSWASGNGWTRVAARHEEDGRIDAHPRWIVMRRFAGSPRLSGSDGPFRPGARWMITRAERRLDTDTVVIAIRGEFDHGSYGLASDVLRRLEAP